MAAVLINLNDVNFTYFDRPLWRGLSWEIQAGQKIGLIGANGTGKSTLLRLILGQHTPESGAIFRQKGLTIGYLAQDAAHLVGQDTAQVAAQVETEQNGKGKEDVTVLEAALSGSPEIARLRHALADKEQQMGEPEVYGDEKRLARVLDEHARLLHSYEAAGGLTYENRVRSTLRDLGLDDQTFDRPLTVLSGGQAKLVGLVRLLIWGPDLLLLDEPDNHLDLTGKERVEKLIREYPGTVIIVSHDRYLLDQVVDRIAELERGQITIWPGTYSEYAINKQIAVLRQEQLYRAQQKRIGQIEAAIARFELWASMVVNERHARQARARHKMLERMDKIEKPGEQARMRLELGGWRGSNKVLDVQAVEKWFEDAASGDINMVLNRVSFQVWHGERVGLVGPNGAGKSVLFRCILAAAAASGNLPLAQLNGTLTGDVEPNGGIIKLGPSVKIGY
jgi:ATP-binding cassette subfamily F protein 3